MGPQFNINLTPTSDNRPGYAVFRLPNKWSGSKKKVEITISQGDNEYLQLSQTDDICTWGPNKDKHLLENFVQEGELHQTTLGPNIVNALVRATVQTSSIVLHDENGLTLEGRLNIKQNSGVLDSSATNTNKPLVEPAPEPEPRYDPEPTPELELKPEIEPELEAKTEPEPEPEPKPKPKTEPKPTPKNKNLKILFYVLGGLIISLFLIGAALWWWLSKDHNRSIDPLGRPTASVTANRACDVSHLGNKTDVEFIQACLKENPSSNELLETIVQAKKLEHCSIAQRLYANKSQSGDIEIASAYVKEYDPKHHKSSSCFSEPDVDTAIYWYEIILNNDPKNKEAKQRLDELKNR